MSNAPRPLLPPLQICCCRPSFTATGTVPTVGGPLVSPHCCPARCPHRSSTITAATATLPSCAGAAATIPHPFSQPGHATHQAPGVPQCQKKHMQKHKMQKLLLLAIFASIYQRACHATPTRPLEWSRRGCLWIATDSRSQLCVRSWGIRHSAWIADQLTVNIRKPATPKHSTTQHATAQHGNNKLELPYDNAPGLQAGLETISFPAGHL